MLTAYSHMETNSRYKFTLVVTFFWCFSSLDPSNISDFYLEEVRESKSLICVGTQSSPSFGTRCVHFLTVQIPATRVYTRYLNSPASTS